MSGRDYGRELYPFLYEDGGGDVDGAALGTLIEQVSASTLAKAREVVELRARMLADHGDELTAAATAMAAAFARGGCLLAFGNGGSATDAADAAADCIRPPVAEWRPLPALSLAADPSVVTAIANDVGFDNVFSRQVIAYGRAGDVAVGFSTSGSSRNVLAGLAQAHRQGLLTIAFAGYDGGRMATEEGIDHCITARSEHVPRIQEGHATAWHALLAATHAALAVEVGDGAGGGEA